ncbi:hypothetical protein [Polaromonas sp. JS666]|uniref:hypothetical protein n=1 Tax=Polaromonas sp. (strain JS666 / ATCC BAA-500) TaxID=296591 RepID=UPI0000532CBE|nr:hypothetical protein [Polaromonas sp. JS666]ABE47346.1 hypothetical protein Bpro_5492 [Polaromonas sp. JS666]
MNDRSKCKERPLTGALFFAFGERPAITDGRKVRIQAHFPGFGGPLSLKNCLHHARRAVHVYAPIEKPTVHELKISLPLGKMALDHQARPGQFLIQETGTGAWSIEFYRKQTSLLGKLAASRFWKRKSFQISVALAAGALFTVGINNFSAFRSGLPFAPPGASQAKAPQSISIAPATYAADPIDLSKLPPPIVEQDGKLPESTLTAGAAGQAGQLSPPAQNLQVAQPAAPNSPQAAVSPTVNTATAKVAQPAVQGAPPLPAQIRPPMPSPVAAATVPDRKAPAVAPAPVKPAANTSADDAKIAVFNEPALALAKPNPGPAAAAAAAATAGTAAAQGGVSAGPVLLTPKVGSTPPSSKSAIRMLAIQDPSSIVVTNPTTRLPMVVKVGQSLPDGSTLKSVDKTALTAVTSKGDQLVLN